MLQKLLLLTALCGAALAGSHSLRYFYTAVHGAPGVPEFSIVGYVDDQQFVRYQSNSESRRMEPRQRWIQEREDAGYWDGQTRTAQGWEQTYKVNVKTVMGRYNQTGGIHTVQQMYGCELKGDGSVGGFIQYGYDGNDFIAFDKDRKVWTAPTAAAVVTKNKWENTPGLSEQEKDYLEQICIEWLRKYVEYGHESLRPVRPEVTLSSPRGSRLSCLATGFYPRAIEVKLLKNGQILSDEESSGTSPNQDGTYQLRKSVEINPTATETYSCQVEHSSLTTPFTVVYTGPEVGGGPPTLIIVVVVIVVLLIVAAAIGGFYLYKKKGGKPGYTPAKQACNTMDSSSNNSSNPPA
uniref:MHC class I antigen n=1 Tax=Callorhinchus milii TaxID=7868 RepID=V9L0X9_CALMI